MGKAVISVNTDVLYTLSLVGHACVNVNAFGVCVPVVPQQVLTAMQPNTGTSSFYIDTTGAVMSKQVAANAVCIHCVFLFVLLVQTLQHHPFSLIQK